MSSVHSDGPRLVVSPDDHRAIIVVIVLISIIWSVMVIGARMIWRFHQKSDFGLDDFVALFGTIISIAQAGVTLVGVRIGFGKKTDLLDLRQTTQAGTYLYAASILYILALCASKASMPLLIRRLTRDPKQILLTYVLLGLSVAWGVASTFGVAFACGAPVPWADEAINTCSGLFPAWVTIETIGLLIEVLILAMAITLVQNLNMLIKFKIAVVGSFGLRLFIIIPVIIRLYYLRQVEASPDAFFSNVNVTIATQLALHYSLWAASFPCMRAFLRAFDTGLGVTTGVPTHRGSNAQHDSKGNSIAMRSFSRDPMNAQKRMSQGSKGGMSTTEKVTGNNSIDTVMKEQDRGNRVGKISEEGSESSQRAIISRTVEWKITYEDALGTTV